MRIFKNKDFNKWAKKQKIKDGDLIDAIDEMNNGLYEASLGGEIYKKRLAYSNKSKQKGARTILAFRIKKIAFFVYGFSKNEKDNITSGEENALKLLASIYLNFNENEIKNAINTGKLIEVKNEKIDT